MIRRRRHRHRHPIQSRSLRPLRTRRSRHLRAVWLSLYSYRLTDPAGREFVGLRNYGVVLTDHLWWSDVATTVLITVVTVAVELVIGEAALRHHRPRPVEVAPKAGVTEVRRSGQLGPAVVVGGGAVHQGAHVVGGAAAQDAGDIELPLGVAPVVRAATTRLPSRPPGAVRRWHYRYASSSDGRRRGSPQ